MKGEWGALKTLAVAYIFGTMLVILMFLTDGSGQKEYARNIELSDGSKADWRDKTASLLYSPGALHAAHFKSEINCQNCHIPGKKVDSQYCTSCHSKEDFKTNTKNEVLRDSHITVMKEMSCFSCHTEHKGLGGNISVVLNLQGHKTKIKQDVQKECKQCHVSDYKRAHPNMSKEACVDCHKLENPFLFTVSTFRHTDVKKLGIDPNSSDFIKLPYPDQGQCEECHKPKFHVGEKGINQSVPSAVDGEFDCLSCHNFDNM